MNFEPYEQTNPRAHGNAPYALRYSGGRPEGSYATIEEAILAARHGASVVTVEGWWIVGRLLGEGGPPVHASPGVLTPLAEKPHNERTGSGG